MELSLDNLKVNTGHEHLQVNTDHEYLQLDPAILNSIDDVLKDYEKKKIVNLDELDEEIEGLLKLSIQNEMDQKVAEIARREESRRREETLGSKETSYSSPVLVIGNHSFARMNGTGNFINRDQGNVWCWGQSSSSIFQGTRGYSGHTGYYGVTGVHGYTGCYGITGTQGYTGTCGQGVTGPEYDRTALHRGYRTDYVEKTSDGFTVKCRVGKPIPRPGYTTNE